MNIEPGKTDTPAPDPAASPSGEPGLQPGRGRPLVEGPPHSVSAPMGAGRINASIGIFSVLGLVGVVILVVVVVFVLVGVLAHH
ncbi:MAG: hypothetical protein ACYDAY_08235 [Candidatus Dormibacteria bacterium]